MDSARIRFGCAGIVLAVALGAAPPTVSAQTLGTFRWQLSPYCNVLTLTVTRYGTHFLLHGTDDHCGGSGASVVGAAFLVPTGSAGFGLTLVPSTGAAPAQLSAEIGLSTLSGTWTDSAGQSGAFVFAPAGSVGGNPRPLAGLGAGAVNPAEVQRRVMGTCDADAAVRAINEDGTVACATGAVSAITSIVAGGGLTGGGPAGAVALGVDFGGSGAALTAARSDHGHAPADATTLDGLDSTQFALSTHAHPAGDATTLDGLDSTQFAQSTHAHPPGDAATLDGLDSTQFALGTHTHAPGDATTVDGLDSTQLVQGEGRSVVQRLEIAEDATSPVLNLGFARFFTFCSADGVVLSIVSVNAPDPMEVYVERFGVGAATFLLTDGIGINLSTAALRTLVFLGEDGGSGSARLTLLTRKTGGPGTTCVVLLEARTNR